MHFEESLNLVDDAIEVTGLVSGGRLVGVSVHRVALPDHLVTGRLDLLDDRRQQIAHLVIAEAGDECEPARLVLRVEAFDVLHGEFRRHGGADLHTDRIRDHLGEGDMRTVELAGPLPDPDIVRRQIVKPGFTELLGEPQHGPLVVEHQSLVAGVDLRGIEVAVIDTTGGHETHPAVDLSRQGFVPCTRG